MCPEQGHCVKVCPGHLKEDVPGHKKISGHHILYINLCYTKLKIQIKGWHAAAFLCGAAACEREEILTADRRAKWRREKFWLWMMKAECASW